jgi:hypothetical protein
MTSTLHSSAGATLLTGWWTWRSGLAARALSLFAGMGLVVFEAAEQLWLGFQPLEGCSPPSPPATPR